MGFWSRVLGFLGIGKKKEELPEIEPPKPKVKLEDIKIEKDKEIETIKKEIKESKPIEIKEKEKYIEKPELPEVSLELKDKINNFKARFESINREKRDKWSSEINPTNRLIKTGYYNDFESLRNSRYDIYRNIILANIDNKEMLDKIYKSGILDEHIVGIVRISMVSKSGKPFEMYYEIQGLTPDKAINSNLFSLEGKSFGNTNELKLILREMSGLDISEAVKVGGSEIRVINVEVGFNYA